MLSDFAERVTYKMIRFVNAKHGLKPTGHFGFEHLL